MRLEVDSLGFMITGKTGTLHFFKKDRLVLTYDLRTGERTVGYKFSELRKQIKKLGFRKSKSVKPAPDKPYVISKREFDENSNYIRGLYGNRS